MDRFHPQHLLGFALGLVIAWAPHGLLDQAVKATNPDAPLPLAVAIHAVLQP